VPDRQIKFFTCYHHFNNTKLDNSVAGLLRFKRKILDKTRAEWWNGKKARVVEDDDALENYVSQKFLDELECQETNISAKDG